MKKAIFICGPTAIGKTTMAIEIAKWLKTEIVSFDSRQFYKELAIGSAHPSDEELASVKHHFIGQLSVDENYDAGKFESDAILVLERIFKTSEYAVLVGGSGMYMKAITDGFDEMPEIPKFIRLELKNELEEKGLVHLQNELLDKDPGYYAQVDLKNPQRIIRALEIIRATSATYSSFRIREKKKRNFEIIKVGLHIDREQLYERINYRVDLMLEQGLLEEVKKVLKHRDENALQTVGYREFMSYFDKKTTIEESIQEVKRNSRRYAKRQLTWFKKEENLKWFEPTEVQSIKSYLKKTFDQCI